MQRREFIARLGGAAAWPLAARAQAAIPVVGTLRVTTAAGSEHFLTGLRQGLAETGFVEGHDVTVVSLWADNRPDRLPTLAADLVRRRVAVIATLGSNNAAQAAMAATTTIPIVFSTGGDAVEAGLVRSMSRPGGNVTGVMTLANSTNPKRLELLAKLLPQAKTIFGLVIPRSDGMENRSDQLRAAARALGREAVVLEVRGENDFEAAFATLAERRAGALFVGVDPIFTANRDKLVQLAARYRIPASYQDRDFVAVGGLMCYGANVPDAQRQVGVYVGRILKGAKPADLPVLQPVKYEFVINLKTARQLGLDVPPTLLALTDDVIE
jgi:putative tryptophan/tyrosine transport system substrate-binding protein